tara:strand:+ start:59 stop:502 length:444 start_codon:yes stop_codon:yes gene_type:complete
VKKTNKDRARDRYIKWRENYIAHNDFDYPNNLIRKKIDKLIKIYIEENNLNNLIALINKDQMYIIEDYIKPILNKNIKKKRSTSKKKSLPKKNNLSYKKPTTQVKRKREPNPYMKHALHSESDLIKNQHLLPCRTCGLSNCKTKNNC